MEVQIRDVTFSQNYKINTMHIGIERIMQGPCWKKTIDNNQKMFFSYKNFTIK